MEYWEKIPLWEGPLLLPSQEFPAPGVGIQLLPVPHWGVAGGNPAGLGLDSQQELRATFLRLLSPVQLSLPLSLPWNQLWGFGMLLRTGV